MKGNETGIRQEHSFIQNMVGNGRLETSVTSVFFQGIPLGQVTNLKDRGPCTSRKCFSWNRGEWHRWWVCLLVIIRWRFIPRYFKGIEVGGQGNIGELGEAYFEGRGFKGTFPFLTRAYGGISLGVSAGIPELGGSGSIYVGYSNFI